MRRNKKDESSSSSRATTSQWSKLMQKLRSMRLERTAADGSLQCYRDVRYALVMNGKPKQDGAGGSSGHRTGSKMSVNRP